MIVTLRLVVCVLAAFALACASGRPEQFLIPQNQLTYEEGERLVGAGEAMIAEGERQVEDGREMRNQADRLVKEGRERRKQGDETAARGRTALRAARMLEEAEKLRRAGDDLLEQAIPTQ